MKKWIPIIFVALFPYVPIVLFSSDIQGEWMIVGTVLAFPLALSGAILHLVFSICYRYNGKELAFLNMLVKLIHIPAYLLIFMIGVSGVMFIHFLAITLVAFLFDCIIIALSGLVSLSATIRLRAEGKIKTGAMVVFSITSFLFCIDVISAIILYIKARKKDLA